MEALRATYGSESSDDGDDDGEIPINRVECMKVSSLPPPPSDLLKAPNFSDLAAASRTGRIRSFPHIEGNYALHVYIPVLIPPTVREKLMIYVKRLASVVPSLYVVDADIPLSELSKDDENFENVLLGREFHISLGRTVPIQVHQIDSIVAMLRQKFVSQRRYFIELSKWDVFVNDEQTRSFLSLEVLGRGLSEIRKQINLVDYVYKLHGLPEFYKNPRPHISLLWALGNISEKLKKNVEELDTSRNNARNSGPIFFCKFNSIECKIGKKSYTICKSLDG
ncbi:U6 snRNA phosphodiesterase isoform X1 [Dioscorea cayenensis subsp. rotundata]|uniref:U6 snRNA phosphodiesterase n=1 Tax=Dioscorea cayennensis subsp. rotundata TaxID=55577 RepID=A0AB40B302_DIOCR|nr:U6 snRNA phosphodiesterase isoform X1 [Dioscorea cayenensis subsp. rotundata]